MIITIVGPTGVGKTRLSLDLANKYNGEIINADSTQVYKEMNIGTAKVINMEDVPHHLIDIRDINEEYTIFDYQKDARDKIDDILARGKTPILVGGSGLYISAVIYDYKLNIEDDNININKTNEEMQKELSKLNIEIDLNNTQRLTRKYIKHIINKEPVESDSKLLYSTLIIGLTTDRETLYNKINSRVDEMINGGLIDEVRELYKKHPNSKQLHSTIDYKELIPYINNEIYLGEAIDAMKKNSRNYAKRQYTWFKNKMDVKWFETDYENFDNTTSDVMDYIAKNKKH